MLRHLATVIFSNTLKQRNSVKFVNPRFQSTDYSANCDGLQVEPKNQVLWIKFDRPEKYNAITKEMYNHITDALTKVNKDSSIKAVVLTGNGDYYSSGNDLTNFVRAMQDEGGPRSGLTKSRDILFRFVQSFINLEKFLIAAVNGPAVGISVSTLPLCDYVICSEKTTFQTPFTALGQCPEACSSLTFPRIMGQSRASELLMLNMTFDAKKALNYGLVSDVVEHGKFHTRLEELLYGRQGIVNTCYPHALAVSKSLVRNREFKESLIEANKKECDEILELWLGEECADAVQKFFKRSKR